MDAADDAQARVLAYLLETKAPAQVVALATLVKDVVHEDNAFSAFAATYKTSGPIVADAKWSEIVSETLFRQAQRRVGTKVGR